MVATVNLDLEWRTVLESSALVINAHSPLFPPSTLPSSSFISVLNPSAQVTKTMSQAMTSESLGHERLVQGPPVWFLARVLALAEPTWPGQK